MPTSLIILALLAADQSANTTVDQISAPIARPSSATVISQAGSRSTKTPPQITTPSRDIPASPTASKTTASQQVARTGPSADAPASGSTPKQGRNTQTEVVSGDDRCDPQSGASADDDCKNVIETRSAEFTPPDTEPLSPEQRLMVTRQTAEVTRDVTNATRRLANGEVDDSNAGLAISSMVTATQPADQGAQPESDTISNDAIVSAIVTSLGVTQQ